MLAYIYPITSRPGYPDQGLPGGSPGSPDQGLPGAPGSPDQGLPGYPGRPGHGLPFPGFPGYPVDPSYGVSEGAPSHPIVLPPLPGVWPPAGTPSHPIALPPSVWPPTVGNHPSHPIYIEGTPEHPITLPPGTVWPPLPPDGVAGGHVVLIWVVGVGARWLVLGSGTPTQPIYTPPAAQPKS